MHLITNKNFFVTSIVLVAFLFLYNSFILESVNDDLKKYYISENLRIALYFLISVTSSSGILILFNKTIFSKWLKKIFSWYLPLSILVTLTGSEGSFVNPGKDDLALFFSWLLFVLTALFLFVQKFYFKVK